MGVACSLRNARWGAGNERLIDDLSTLDTEAALKDYLTREADLHLQNFIDAGRKRGLAFDEIHRNLRSLAGDRGLSNSEVALAAGLWAAARCGAEIEHLSLAEHFPPAGAPRKLELLKERLVAADGLLVSGPVYFGDRGSLAQDLVDLIRGDDGLRSAMADRVYAGIAVGAKRNGGQETTLIYQLLDLVGLGLLGVGNDSDTTSQYGGTGHAGDIGTMARDEYGLWTSMGAGRRLARVSTLMKLGGSAQIDGKVKIHFWLLQDTDGIALNFVRDLCAQAGDRMEGSIVDVGGSSITRCIACDICPTHIDTDDVYRCIIRGSRDSLPAMHAQLLYPDAIVPVVYSSRPQAGAANNYQRFIERTRYLRRGDYVYTDCLTAPLVLEDLGTGTNMPIRMVTSLIRHHTVVAEPMILYRADGAPLNAPQVARTFNRFVDQARRLTVGRLRAFADSALPEAARYNPVGYILSTEKEKEDRKLNLRAEAVERRRERMASDARSRLAAQRAGPAT